MTESKSLFCEVIEIIKTFYDCILTKHIWKFSKVYYMKDILEHWNIMLLLLILKITK